jgi:hypothetical protein
MGRCYRERLWLCWRRCASTGCREILGLAQGLDNVLPEAQDTNKLYLLLTVRSQNLNLVLKNVFGIKEVSLPSTVTVRSILHSNK